MKSSGSSPRSKGLRSEKGSEVAEAAVVLPVLFLVLFSIYWFGQAFATYGTINHAAREGARTAAVPACASCSGCTWGQSNLPCDASVVGAVSTAMVAAHLDPTQAQPLAPNPTPISCTGLESPCINASSGAPGGITICRNVVLDRNSSAPQACGVIVSFQYPYQMSLPFSSLSNQPILLSGVAEVQGAEQ
jgi:TadE-like protein